MKYLFAFCLLLATHSVFAQCISIKEMRSFAKKGLGEREDFMEARGYVSKLPIENDKTSSYLWLANNQIENFVLMWPKDKNGSYKDNFVVMNQLPNSASCIQAIKSEIATLELHNDAEFYKNKPDGVIHFIRYYSSKNYGIRLLKITYTSSLRYEYSITFINNKPQYNAYVKDRF